VYKCETCDTELSVGCFATFPDGSRHARCHGCLAFCVIPADAPDPFDPSEYPATASDRPAVPVPARSAARTRRNRESPPERPAEEVTQPPAGDGDETGASDGDGDPGDEAAETADDGGDDEGDPDAETGGVVGETDPPTE